ncbi:dihydrofolate reductase family protein [Microbacterium sp. CJ88]|uniref:dihydrofolate reductase family protein n=1 Tax=Microbacterium sp. CJ88 TaxID=3445672 RepID=UPI003F654BCC
MRKVIVNNIVSIDGYFSDPVGNPMVLNMDEAFNRANLESIEGAAVVLLGRDSFDFFSAYWPFIADAPADPGNPQFDDVNRAISRRYNVVPKTVASDRGPVPADNAWHDATTVVPRADIADWVATARRQDGDGDVVVFASHVLWNALLADGLVDELHLMVSPDAVGTGVPLFTAPARLELMETRRFDGSSNVQLRYRMASRT